MSGMSTNFGTLILILFSCVLPSLTADQLNSTTEAGTDLEETTVYFITQDVITLAGDEREQAESTVAITTTDAATTMERDGDQKERVWRNLRTKFTLWGKRGSSFSERLRNVITSSMNVIFRERIPDFNTTSTVEGMSTGQDNHLIAFVTLAFEPSLANDERREVIKVLYEIVERNHTLGTLPVAELHVGVPNSDKYVRISDACKITACPREMICTSVGNECQSMCANNTDYCLNGAECADENFRVTCMCREDLSGPRCADKMSNEDNAKTNLYVGIIAASSIAGIIVLAIIVASCINLFNKRGGRTGKSDELFGIENVVALELNDEKTEIDGIGTQTDESFLLARSHKDGVPPKQGYAHKIMQTNDSFLLTKAQLLRSHGVVSHNRGAGSPVGVVSANTGRLSGPNSSRVIEGGTAPSTSSSSAANGKPRKASTKKERAPSSPDGHASTSKSDTNTLPTASEKSEQPPPSQEGVPTRSDDKNAEHRVDELTKESSQNGDKNDVKKPSQVKADQSNASELYPGRKILKV